MKLGPLEIHWRRTRPYHEARSCWTALNPVARNVLVDAVVTAAGEGREGPLGTTIQDLQSAIDLSKRTASAQFAQTRAAIGDAVDWVARTHLQTGKAKPRDAKFWHSMYKDQLRRKRALHARFDGFYRSVGDALDEALSERDREPSTDVWASFWDRVTEGGAIPHRNKGGNDNNPPEEENRGR